MGTCVYDAKTEMSVLKSEKLKTKRNRAPREDSSPLRDGDGSPVSTRFDEKPISSAPETTTTLPVRKRFLRRSVSDVESSELKSRSDCYFPGVPPKAYKMKLDKMESDFRQMVESMKMVLVKKQICQFE